jgi:hypothetical protein
MVIMAVILQQNGHADLIRVRRMAHGTSSDQLVVPLLAALREEPSGVNDPHNFDLIRRIMKGNEKQFCFSEGKVNRI